MSFRIVNFVRCLTLSTIVFSSGCGISTRNIRADGTVVIDVVGEDQYRVGGELYFYSGLWDALARPHADPMIKRFALRIPRALLGDNIATACGHIARVMAAAKVTWKAYSWEPPAESSQREIPCDFIIVA